SEGEGRNRRTRARPTTSSSGGRTQRVHSLRQTNRVRKGTWSARGAPAPGWRCRSGRPGFLLDCAWLESGDHRTLRICDGLSIDRRRPPRTEPMLPDQDGQSTRLRSLDAYRGFVMLAMASGGAGLLAGFIDNGESFGSILVHMLRQQLDHVDWRGG